MQQTHTHKAVTRRVEAKKLLSRRRQSEYSANILPLKVLATISYFKFHFFPHLLIILQFRDISCVLNLSTKAVLQKWHIQCKRAKYL